MNLKRANDFLAKRKQPKFRLEQIRRAVFEEGVTRFSEISVLPKNLREELDKKLHILSFSVKKIQVSLGGDSAKALLELVDDHTIETVLISSKRGLWSACISSQAGCPMGCVFCATGKGGFSRNLTAEEISDQVLFWKQFLRGNLNLKGENKKLTNVVYMGMGEPMLNWKNVKESLKSLTDQSLFFLGSRSISVSTVGVSGGLEKLAHDFPQVNLAISLHFLSDEKRSKYMPANKKYNLVNLRKDINEYLEKTNRKVFLEYIMFRDINDSREDALALVRYIRSFSKPHLLHVNLIKYNPILPEKCFEKSKAKDFLPTGTENVFYFCEFLLQKGINCTIRKSLGADIYGACGQLAGKN